MIEAQTWLRENEVNTRDDLQRLQEKLERLQRVVRSMPKDLVDAPFGKLAVDKYSSELSAKTAALAKEVSKFD